MKPRQDLKDKETCKDTLNFLNYLRKSQCTQTIEGRNRLNHPYLTPNKDDQCKKTLDEMEKVAKECSEGFGYKR